MFKVIFISESNNNVCCKIIQFVIFSAGVGKDPVVSFLKENGLMASDPVNVLAMMHAYYVQFNDL